VRIEMADLKSFRITRNGQQVTLMQRDGTTHSAFFFQHGNVDCFVTALKGNIKTARWGKPSQRFSKFGTRILDIHITSVLFDIHHAGWCSGNILDLYFWG